MSIENNKRVRELVGVGNETTPPTFPNLHLFFYYNINNINIYHTNSQFNNQTNSFYIKIITFQILISFDKTNIKIIPILLKHLFDVINNINVIIIITVHLKVIIDNINIIYTSNFL